MFNPFYMDCASEQLIRSAQEEAQRLDRKRLTHSTRFNDRSPSEHAHLLLPNQIAPDQGYALTLFVEGRTVTGVDIQIGWNHQGLEKRLESTPWIDIAANLRTITNCDGSALEVAYQNAFEELCGAQVQPLLVRLSRLISIEQERIAHHRAVLRRVAQLFGLGSLSLNELAAHSVVRERLSNKAKIDRNSALSLGLSGITLRATGLADDLRLFDNTYSLLEFRPQVRIESDAYARLLLRIAEISQSEALIENAKRRIQEEKSEPVSALQAVPQHRRGSAFVEGPEGEVMVWVVSGAHVTPSRIRIKTPAFSLASAISSFLINVDIDDVVLILATLGIQPYELDR